MTRSRLAMTHPTRGLGSVVSSPRAASSRARVIENRSKSENMARYLLAVARNGCFVIARQQRQLIAVDGRVAFVCSLGLPGGRRRYPLSAQLFDLLMESLDILKLTIHGREAHV